MCGSDCVADIVQPLGLKNLNRSMLHLWGGVDIKVYVNSNPHEPF